MAKAMNHPMNATEHVLPQAWRGNIGIMLAAFVVLAALYWQTLFSMVEIWSRSDTFAHGFLVFPICAYLIWRKREDLVALSPRPDWRFLSALPLLGFGWLVANLGSVMVLQQFALIGMILVLVPVLAGWAVTLEILFPLGFLFFAVPFGEFLLRPMMYFTADFAVAMLQLTGIPVYREGTYFSLPTGDWSVIAECSGLRYLIASITLGFLYGYLSYRSLWRRLAFMVFACVFPVFANGLRAYMTVMIGHLLGMQYAEGVAHVVYGWVFFGIVMALMFWIGSFWSDENGAGSRSMQPVPVFGNVQKEGQSVLLTAGLALLLVGVWPAWAGLIERAAYDRRQPVHLDMPAAAGSWQYAETAQIGWEPRYLGAEAKGVANYSDGRNRVTLFLMYYRQQAQGHELINSENILLTQGDPVWRMPEEQQVRVLFEGEPLDIRQGRLLSTTQSLLVWRWNWTSGMHTVNDYHAKLLEVRDKLTGNVQDGAGIVLAAPYVDNPREAASVLQAFLDDMAPSIERSLSEASRR